MGWPCPLLTRSAHNRGCPMGDVVDLAEYRRRKFPFRWETEQQEAAAEQFDATFVGLDSAPGREWGDRQDLAVEMLAAMNEIRAETERDR